jgi:regulator of replication initiation timing
MFSWLFKKEEKVAFEQHKGAVQTALNNVKQDMTNISKWIKHLDHQDSNIKEDIQKIMEDISSIKNELEEMKNVTQKETVVEIAPVFKQRQTARAKQTADYGVQTAVQTAVQAAFFTKLSISEKAIIGILMNSELKLSYEDLAAITGKDTTTIRGQVNSIKQKCSDLIEEQIEKNGKKRLYVPEKIKGLLLKKARIGKKKIEEYTE